MNHGEMAAQPPATPSIGQALLDKLRGLTGTWDAPLGTGVMTDIFKPFAFDTAILGEEWLNGKQITSTVFYVVNGELRADHYCDYLNQPRYTAVPSMDPDLIDFQFREATNLDTHPKHFHGAKWKIVDATHMVQDWFVMGGRGIQCLCSSHTWRVHSVRAEGSAAPANRRRCRQPRAERVVPARCTINEWPSTTDRPLHSLRLWLQRSSPAAR